MRNRHPWEDERNGGRPFDQNDQDAEQEERERVILELVNAIPGPLNDSRLFDEEL